MEGVVRPRNLENYVGVDESQKGGPDSLDSGYG